MADGGPWRRSTAGEGHEAMPACGRRDDVSVGRCIAAMAGGVATAEVGTVCG
jgi:hypothetical protein